MRRKLMGVTLGAIVAVSGFAVAGLGSGVAATADTTTATTTGTTVGTTTGSTATGGTTTAATTSTAPTTSTVTVTSTVTTTVTDTSTVVVRSKVALCHRVGGARHHRWVVVKVAPAAVDAHLRHGDKPTARGGCGWLKHR